MKVIFKSDLAYDSKASWDILHDEDPAGTLSRAKSMDISEKELDYILSQKRFNEDDTFFKEIVNKRYEKEKDAIEGAISSYQSAWDEINDFFSLEIERITVSKWKYDEYFVILSPFNPGISN